MIGELHLFPAPKKLSEPNEEVMKMLETLLTRAKSGKIRALAIAGLNSDKTVTTAWMLDGSAYDLAPAVMTLQHEFGRLLANSETVVDDESA